MNLKLETCKACQDTDTPKKIIEKNADIFSNVFLSSFDVSVKKPNFPSSLKIANITPVARKTISSKCV